MLQCLFRSLFLFTVLAAVGVSAGPAAGEGYTTGTPWTGEPGIRESTRDLMLRQAAQPRKRLARIHKPANVEVPEGAEEAAALPSPAQSFAPLALGSSFAQSVATNF